MEDLSTTAGPRSIICPACEAGHLQTLGRDSRRCDECGSLISGPVLKTLEDILTLPDVIGAHACECGHPEMRRLPDGVYFCPSCGSEVLPPSTTPTTWKSPDHSEAYWCGWLDGRYREIPSFTTNRRLKKWEEPHDRLDYYLGHRAGREARLRKTSLLEAS